MSQKGLFKPYNFLFHWNILFTGKKFMQIQLYFIVFSCKKRLLITHDRIWHYICQLIDKLKGFKSFGAIEAAQYPVSKKICEVSVKNSNSRDDSIKQQTYHYKRLTMSMSIHCNGFIAKKTRLPISMSTCFCHLHLLQVQIVGRE